MIIKDCYACYYTFSEQKDFLMTAHLVPDSLHDIVQ